MTICELRAFLEGMDVQECPTPAQWARIREKIDGLKLANPAPERSPTFFADRGPRLRDITVVIDPHLKPTVTY